MNTITLPRTGDSPLRFQGELLAEAGGPRFNGQDINRFHVLQIYRSDGGRFVVAIEFVSRWQGEAGANEAHVCRSGDDVRRVLREYEPIGDRVGFPDKPEFADRQRRLTTAIREQYDACVSELLSRDEFATSLDEAQRDQYAELDGEAIMCFVRHVLGNFPMTRGEACALCDANNGAMLFPQEFWWSGLWANIADTPPAALSDKWKCDAGELSRRIHAADVATQFALAYAVAQFWRHCERDTDELLVECGFTIVEVTRD